MSGPALVLGVLIAGGLAILGIDLYFVIRHKHPSMFGPPIPRPLPPSVEPGAPQDG